MALRNIRVIGDEVLKKQTRELTLKIIMEQILKHRGDCSG